MSPPLVKCAMTSLTRSAAVSPPPSPSMWTRRTAPAPPAGSAPPPPGRSVRTSRRTWPGRPSRRDATQSMWRCVPSPAAVDTTNLLCLHDLFSEITFNFYLVPFMSLFLIHVCKECFWSIPISLSAGSIAVLHSQIAWGKVILAIDFLSSKAGC